MSASQHQMPNAVPARGISPRHAAEPGDEPRFFPRFFSFIVASLRDRGRDPCLAQDGRWFTRDEVANAVEHRIPELGEGRRLILLEAANTVSFVVSYLAALEAGHAVIVAGSRVTVEHEELVSRYRPDTVVSTRDGEAVIAHLADRPAHALHQDLAVLLSTSGSTGSPKLVRLSRRAISANAESIASYLGLTPADRGITSLPLSYCYGLSVLHSHLVAGASVVLTDKSVVDECFWEAVRSQSVTNLAGVPHTFDLIDRVGRDRLDLPHLRFVTQAGGRLAPDRVREYANFGRGCGWDFFVMYGQTEATARMAYLPPGLAVECPDRVGVAIPGGSFHIRPLPGRSEHTPADPDVGQVVYRGPNVMMGYAEHPDDLCRGPDLDELVTGDLGRIDELGLLEIVGREHRFAKLFGLRVDLQRLEGRLSEAGTVAVCASDDRRLYVATETAGAEPQIRAVIGEHSPVPDRCVSVATVAAIPRFANGKPDYRAVIALGEDALEPAGGSIPELFQTMLGCDEVTGSDTFVSLGGDSLSYVELSMRLEEVLGELPHGWHLLSLDELSAMTPTCARRVARVETSVVLRAMAILAIVVSHMRLYYVPFGGHLLLAVGGYNFARFQLGEGERPAWLTRLGRPFVKIGLVTAAWIALSMAIWGGYGLEAALLVNNYLGGADHTGQRWHYWYLEVVVQIGVVLILLFSIKPVRRLEKRWPLGFVLVLLVPALVARFELVVLGSGTRNSIFQTDTVVWLFLLGWAIERAKPLGPRLLVTATVLATVPGYFHDTDRSARLLIGVLLLLWIPALPVPRPFNRLVGWLASASLVLYLTHYRVFPTMKDWLPDGVAFVATVGIGLALWAAIGFVASRARPAIAARSRTVRRRIPSVAGPELVPGTAS